jgi:hypothetical protein
MFKGMGEANGDFSHLKLKLKPSSERSYSNAQWDDYRDLKRKGFIHRPSLTFECEAKWNGPDDLIGTSGFGFWNDPFMMTGWRWPTLPQAFWFLFESKRSKLSFTHENKHEHGLSAMVMDAKSWPCMLWSFFSLITFPLLLWPRWCSWTRKVWPRSLNQAKTTLAINMRSWQRYQLKWQADGVSFWVNGELVLHKKVKIAQPQGLVIWMDNQYAVIEPWGIWSFGSESIVEEQSLELRSISCS